MIRGDPTVKECLELLQARTGRGLVEISQAIAQMEECFVAAKDYPSARSFLEIQSVAQTAFQRWVDRAIADLEILLSAGKLNRTTVSRMAALELGGFAEKIKDATKAETFREVVNPRSIRAERHMYAQLLLARLRRFEEGVMELQKVETEESRSGTHEPRSSGTPKPPKR